VRRYASGNTSGINFSFESGVSVSSSRPILKPPKFVFQQPRRVTQSSWVAGGYWHQVTLTVLNGNAHFRRKFFGRNILQKT
jgi:hypothetical protein